MPFLLVLFSSIGLFPMFYVLICPIVYDLTNPTQNLFDSDLTLSSHFIEKEIRDVAAPLRWRETVLGYKIFGSALLKWVPTFLEKFSTVFINFLKVDGAVNKVRWPQKKFITGPFKRAIYRWATPPPFRGKNQKMFSLFNFSTLTPYYSQNRPVKFGKFFSKTS